MIASGIWTLPPTSVDRYLLSYNLKYLLGPTILQYIYDRNILIIRVYDINIYRDWSVECMTHILKKCSGEYMVKEDPGATRPSFYLLRRAGGRFGPFWGPSAPSSVAECAKEDILNLVSK